MRRRQIIYLGIVLITVVLTTVSYYSYAFFTSKSEQRGKLNIITGTLDYRIESTDLVDNYVEIEANSTKTINLKIISLNEIDSKYKLYYSSSSDAVKVVCSDDTTTLPEDTITTNEEKNISVDLTNESDDIQRIEFGIQGGFVSNEIALDENKKAVTFGDFSFATDSMETIVNNIRKGRSFLYAPTNAGKDAQVLREIDMGELGIHYLRVANTTPCTNGETSETACGFVIEFADIISIQKMNITNTNVGGYPESAIFPYVTNTVYDALPEEIRNSIIPTTVVSSHGSDDTDNFTTPNQKLYLLSAQEIFGNHNYSVYDSASTSTRQLDYYRFNNTDANRIKKYQGSTTIWWLRSSYTSNNGVYAIVSTGGSTGYNYASAINGVTPAFRIG